LLSRDYCLGWYDVQNRKVVLPAKRWHAEYESLKQHFEGGLRMLERESEPKRRLELEAYLHDLIEFEKMYEDLLREQLADELLPLARAGLVHDQVQWYEQTLLDVLHEQNPDEVDLHVEQMLLMATMADNIVRRSLDLPEAERPVVSAVRTGATTVLGVVGTASAIAGLLTASPPIALLAAIVLVAISLGTAAAAWRWTRGRRKQSKIIK
jgi:hypothetical protein